MLKHVLTTAAAGLLVLAGASSAFASGASVTQTSLTVPASAPAGVSIATNKQFTSAITVSGATAAGEANCSSDLGCPSGPGGIWFGVSDSLLPSAVVGALIYRIDGGSWAVLGDQTVSLPAYSGVNRTITLAYNDSAHADNTGAYTVGITRTKP